MRSSEIKDRALRLAEDVIEFGEKVVLDCCDEEGNTLEGSSVSKSLAKLKKSRENIKE